MAKSYKEYIRVASAQILIKRGRCSHPEDWKEEETLYFRCHDCGAFVPFRNPFDIKKRGEFSQVVDEETPEVEVPESIFPPVLFDPLDDVGRMADTSKD